MCGALLPSRAVCRGTAVPPVPVRVAGRLHPGDAVQHEGCLGGTLGCDRSVFLNPEKRAKKLNRSQGRGTLVSCKAVVSNPNSNPILTLFLYHTGIVYWFFPLSIIPIKVGTKSVVISAPTCKGVSTQS